MHNAGLWLPTILIMQEMKIRNQKQNKSCKTGNVSEEEAWKFNSKSRKIITH
jgi:hypothetical protein